MPDDAKHPVEVSFDVPADEQALIDKIVQRGRALDKKNHVRGITTLHCVMDICAVHANGTPLRLADLLSADDFNFAHDWYGIRRHLDRETGQLRACFSPRASAHSFAAAA
nr:hypothetical protein [Brevundimonas diminuta]